MTKDSKIANIIMRLKEVKDSQPELTLQKISEHTGVSMSTIQRVFAEGSEGQSFRYESIRPVAKMLLGLDNLDEGEDDEKALKAIIQYKDTTIEEMKAALAEVKEKYEKKLEKERTQNRTSIDFLKHQIELKDDRIDLLMNALEDRNKQYQMIHTKYLNAVEQLMQDKSNNS